MEFAAETAYLAGRLTLAYFGTGVQADYKTDNSPVTIADRKAEELIRSRIEQAYPGHAIIGEEYGRQEADNADHHWFIDPIDGTKSFIRGVPLYAVLLGLEIEGQAQVGAAYFPALDELIYAGAGLGCWWNGRRAHVSTIAEFDRAYMTTTSVQAFERCGRKQVFERLARRCYFQTGWSDAYGYLLVATGRAEIMMDPVMSEWDCGPFPAILSEAGGYFGDWKGRITIHGHEGLATNAALRNEVLAMTNQDD
jgi:myo-inositol-1(or 4)-monophosphatase